MSDGSGFFGEMKRRHVWRVVVAYAATVWVLLQLASIILPTFGTPPWALKSLIALFVILFPVTVVLAWAFEVTPEGVRRTEAAASIAARAPAETLALRHKLNTGIIVASVIAVALLGWRLFAVRHAAVPAGTAKLATAASVSTRPTAMTAIPAKSIAVLPFENLSDDKNNAYFVAGMQDLILTKLADIGSLKVISRTSTMKYQSRPDNLKQIAAELGVATILEGSVQKIGNEVLVNVQLIDAATDAHLWAHSYTRTLDNVFGVEGEVAGKIATALDAKLSPQQAASLAKVPTTNKAAYDAFLRAEYQADQFEFNNNTASLKSAIGLYRQAVAKDPKFALAFARLSRAESWLAFKSGAGEDMAQLIRQARADADTALKLAPDLAAAHLALGYSAYWGHRDYAEALKAFGAVLALHPDDADALAAQGYVQRRMGDLDAALASLNQAVALDPRHFTPTNELASTYAMISRYPEAESWYQRALAIKPDSVLAKTQYAKAILYGSGDIPHALAVVQGDDPHLKSLRAYLLGYQRKFREAIALLQSIPDTPDNFAPGYGSKALHLGQFHWQAGDKTNARALFAKALVQDRAALQNMTGLTLASAWDIVGIDEIGAGNTAAGLAAIAKSEAIVDASHDALYVPNFRLNDAEAYAMAGRADLAVPLLARALAAPGIGVAYSPMMLWLDPGWDPIRHDSGFQALEKNYAKYKPAVTYTTPPAAAGSAPSQ